MESFLFYDLKVAALLTVFYMFWRLLLERETFYRLNRAVLLSVAMLSVVLPMCVIKVHKSIEAKAVYGADGQQVALSPLAPSDMPAPSFFDGSFFGSNVLAIILVAGILFYIGRTLWGVYSLSRLIRSSEQHVLADGIRVAVCDAPLTPCSWMNTVVMSRADYSADCSAILAHERAHIRCGHSRDVLLMELLSALQWWNPVVWFLRQDLRTLHEYEADAGVLSQGFDAKQYVELLMQKARGVQVCALANGISIKNENKTKKRILMLIQQKQSPKRRYLRALYLLPIAAVSLALSAKTVEVYKVVETYDDVQPAVHKADIQTAVPKADVDTCLQELDPATLFVVDDKPMTEAEFKQLSGNGKDLAQSIAHAEILSSEKAVKVFGERAAAGAVVIHTKAYEAAKKSASLSPVVQQSAKDTSATQSSADDDPIVQKPEVLPIYKGGETELYKFLSTNVRYPKEAQDAGVQGRAIVQFVIEKDGSVSNAKVLDSSGSSLRAVVVTAYRQDMTEEEKKEREKAEMHNAGVKAINDEAIRVVKASGGHWTPGKQNGQTVRTQFVLPIMFKLQ